MGLFVILLRMGFYFSAYRLTERALFPAGRKSKNCENWQRYMLVIAVLMHFTTWIQPQIVFRSMETLWLGGWGHCCRSYNMQTTCAVDTWLYFFAHLLQFDIIIIHPVVNLLFWHKNGQIKFSTTLTSTKNGLHVF